MIKKIFLGLLLFYMIVSCGKKGDPFYKDPKEKTDMRKIIINVS